MIASPGLQEGIDRLHRQAPMVLAEDVTPRLAKYLELLARWNRTHNLTAIREPERMITHHLLDALAVLPHLPTQPGLRVLDVGSGGGVPGLVLAIARPDWRVVVLDSNHKKGAFLQQAIIELELGNAEAVTIRVEDYAPAERFGIVISRAFSDLAAFAETSGRHLAPDGQLIAMKGVYPDEELANLPSTLRVVATPALAVPGVDAERHLIVMRALE